MTSPAECAAGVGNTQERGVGIVMNLVAAGAFHLIGLGAVVEKDHLVGGVSGCGDWLKRGTFVWSNASLCYCIGIAETDRMIVGQVCSETASGCESTKVSFSVEIGVFGIVSHESINVGSTTGCGCVTGQTLQRDASGGQGGILCSG